MPTMSLTGKAKLKHTQHQSEQAQYPPDESYFTWAGQVLMKYAGYANQELSFAITNVRIMWTLPGLYIKVQDSVFYTDE